MQGRHHTGSPSSFQGPEPRFPKRALHRPHHTLLPESNITDSPHVHVTKNGFPCRLISPESDMSSCSVSDPPTRIETTRQQALLTPDLRQETSSFEEWRMPSFSSKTALPEILKRDDDLRDIQSIRTSSTSMHRHLRSGHHRNTLSSLGGSSTCLVPGEEDFQTFAASSSLKGSHRRGKNIALGAAQFDDILSEVFYE